MATDEVNDKMHDSPHFGEFVFQSIARHISGDWGDMCKEDKETNEEALTEGNRLFSAYVDGLTQIWIITEADRSCTTVLFPHEY